MPNSKALTISFLTAGCGQEKNEAASVESMWKERL